MWIYNLIESRYSDNEEQVLIENDEWCMCIDKHPGDDTRYLVVFKDTSLRTIRDLCKSDIDMLTVMYRRLRAYFLKEGNTLPLNWYFHYMPSVFQLHLHINNKSISHLNVRTHRLAHVVRNLKIDGDWYKKALILTNRGRLLKSDTGETPRKYRSIKNDNCSQSNINA